MLIIVNITPNGYNRYVNWDYVFSFSISSTSFTFLSFITSVMASFLLISLSSHFLNSSFSASELDSGSGMGNLALFLLGGIVAAEGRLVTVEDGRLPLEVDGTGTLVAGPLLTSCVPLVLACAGTLFAGLSLTMIWPSPETIYMKPVI